jgi:heptosyltransferase-2
LYAEAGELNLSGILTRFNNNIIIPLYVFNSAALNRILIIQTAFIGDVILATPVAEKLHHAFPGAKIDFLVKKGNQMLFENHPFINTYIYWNKDESKYQNLRRVIAEVRKNRYDLVVNLHRFFSTGLITVLSKSKRTIGFDKNPLSFLFSKRVKHLINNENNGGHEIDRNLALIEDYGEKKRFMPRLYPSIFDNKKFESYGLTDYICIAPASVWFTKQYPREKWIEFIKNIGESITVCYIGSAQDKEVCREIMNLSEHKNSHNLAGMLTLLETAAIVQHAKMNFVNDSAPMHIASATNAPVTAIYCSTLPAFGFGPLSDVSFVVETDVQLDCKPCGIHGFDACPEKHFKCALAIDTKKLLDILHDCLNA